MFITATAAICSFGSIIQGVNQQQLQPLFESGWESSGEKRSEVHCAMQEHQSFIEH